MSGLETPLTVRFTEEDLEAIGRFAAAHRFGSKSALVRTALIAFVEDKVLTDPKLYEDLRSIVQRLEHTLGAACRALSGESGAEGQAGTAGETLARSRAELQAYMAGLRGLREALDRNKAS